MVQKDILWRYFNQTATPEEQQIVSEWLADARQREEILEFIRSAWEEEHAGSEPAMPFEKVFEEAIRREGNTAQVVPLYRKKWYWAAAAAAVLAILATGVLIGYSLSRPAKEGSDEWMLAEAHTGHGQIAQLVLSDGSEVILNADSRITFPKSKDVQPVVYLEGEAMFDIRSNKKPVIIRTKELVTTANGSQVKISAFPKDSTVTVSVEKGKAEISTDTKTFPLLKLRIPGKDSTGAGQPGGSQPKTMPLIKLRPVVVKENQSVTINRKNGIARMNHNAAENTMVVEGSLSFTNAGAAEIVQKLEQHFGIAVSLNTNGATLPPYSAAFSNASLEMVLEHLDEALNLDHFITNDRIYLVTRKTK